MSVYFEFKIFMPLQKKKVKSSGGESRQALRGTRKQG